MSTISRLMPATLGLLACVACGGQQQAAPQQAAAADTAPRFVPTATVRELMINIIDPSGDLVWDAASTVIDDKGVNDIVPKSDEEWASVRRGAIALMESANLLQLPGRQMAQPHEKSIAPGVELEPAAIQALRDNDPKAWNDYAIALHDAALKVRDAVDAKDSSKLVELGEAMDKACESCHRHYWYPNEKIPEFPSGETQTNPTDVKK